MSLRTGLAYGFVAGVCLGLHNGVMIGVDWGMREGFGRGDFSPAAIIAVGFAVSFVIVSLVGYGLHSRLTFLDEHQHAAGHGGDMGLARAGGIAHGHGRAFGVMPDDRGQFPAQPMGDCQKGLNPCAS